MNSCDACDLIPARGPLLYFICRPAPPEWPVLEISSNVKALLGYCPEDFMSGRVGLPSITHPDDRAAVEADILRRIGAREPEWMQEMRFVTRDGHVRWFQNWTQIQYDTAGAPTLMQTVALDVTANRSTLEALRDSERRYRLLYQSMSDAFVRVDMQGRIVECNKAYAEMLGRTPEELASLTYVDLTPAKWHAMEAAIIKDQVLVHGCSEVYEKEYLRKDGSVFPIELRTYLLRDDRGEPACMWALVRDITNRNVSEKDRRALEARLQRMEKSESLGLMAAGIAHDFNNILAAISGNLDLALSGQNSRTEMQAHLGAAQEATRRAADLCRHMLAYSGGGLSDRRLTTLDEILAPIREAGDAGFSPLIRFTQHLADKTPPIEADTAQVRQVIGNVLANASEAIGDKPGTITLTTSVRSCRASDLLSPWQDDALPEGEYVCIEIADTGCGMDNDTLRRMFDPFFSTKFTGRGLGLPTALGIIRSHRGAIQVESRLAQGTTVRLLIPVARASTTATARDTHTGETHAGCGTVMIVDDEPAIREMAAQMLRRAGYTPLACPCGRTALSEFALHHEQIRCVLLDVTMPGLSGEETLAELRKIEARVPVLVMSGYSREDVASRFSGLGDMEFLQKPFTMRALHKTMAGLLGAGSAA